MCRCPAEILAAIPKTPTTAVQINNTPKHTGGGYIYPTADPPIEAKPANDDEDTGPAE